jgi:hypothetical protein
LLKWKLRRRGEENKCMLDGIMNKDVMVKTNWETLRWTKLLKWKN